MICCQIMGNALEPCYLFTQHSQFFVAPCFCQRRIGGIVINFLLNLDLDPASALSVICTFCTSLYRLLLWPRGRVPGFPHLHRWRSWRPRQVQLPLPQRNSLQPELLHLRLVVQLWLLHRRGPLQPQWWDRRWEGRSGRSLWPGRVWSSSWVRGGLRSRWRLLSSRGQEGTQGRRRQEAGQTTGINVELNLSQAT